MGIALALLATGVVAGILGALLGLGGGIFLVPALTLFFHLPIHAAVGTSLVGVIATSAGVAAIAPRGRGADVPLALRLEVLTAAGAIGGGLLAGVISTQVLSVLFALVVFFTAGYLMYKARHRANANVPERMFYTNYELHHWPTGMAVSSLAGMISGLLGVGGGFIKVPVIYAIMGAPLGVATATSNFMVGITAAASVFVYYGRGDIHPLVVIPTALGVFAGAMVGVYVLPRLRVAWIRLGLVGLLVVMGVQMLVRGLTH
ncbi:MAG: sulfite exporter TauE/SafE family protein [Anaerolineae bacterium]|jgi:hypothetical protein